MLQRLKQCKQQLALVRNCQQGVLRKRAWKCLGECGEPRAGRSTRECKAEPQPCRVELCYLAAHARRWRCAISAVVLCRQVLLNEDLCEVECLDSSSRRGRVLSRE
eukprot:scaffold45421_cov22-Tisochrysis_lutea.AAC.1